MLSRFIQQGTLIILALLPSYLLRWNFLHIPTTVLEIMLLVVIVAWLIESRRRLRELTIIERPWAIAIALILLSATISAIYAPDIFSALGTWKAYFFEPIIFFYLIRDLLKRNILSVDSLLIALVAGGFIAALTAIAQWIFHTGIPIPWDIENRATGVFDYPNALGLYLGPLIVIAVANLLPLAKGEAGRGSGVNAGRLRPFWLSAIILFSIAIILAQSEAAIASVLVTIVLMGIVHPTFHKKTLTIVAIALVLLFAIPQTRTYTINKLTFQDRSEQVRLSQWTETLQLLKDHPLKGAGLSGYPIALKPYHLRTDLEIFQYPHNVFLNVWVELGLLGLIGFFLLLFLIVRRVFLLPTSYFLLLSLPPLLQTFLHGLVDVPYFKNDLAILTWTLLAIFTFATTYAAKHK